MYTALYRKKRPNTFKSVIGQSAIITTLGNQLKNGNITHAYLFCGTRGTGKTSCAKIFARAVNCPNATKLGDPCNECETCNDILAERNLNVIEIDAASNNGVDNIRDLRDEVKYPPSTGKYKVYIIDEAHMLTTAAFNALLKTLEEPPGHIVFILATTDPAKIPATILSRVQRYDFKRINRHDMVNTLSQYMQNENINLETDAAEYIAAVSDGAMRDALSVLDQCLSLYAGEGITLKNVQNLLGAVDQSSLFAYGDALLQKNTSAALNIIASSSKEGRDLSRFTADIITHFRNLLVASQVNNPAEILDYAPETVEKYRTSGANISVESIIDFIKEFSQLQNQMRFLPSERLALEVCTIKLCNVGATAQTTNRLPASNIPTPPAPTPTSTNQLPTSNAPTPHSNDWQGFCATLGGLLKSMLSLCKVDFGETITITCRDQASTQYLKEQSETISTEIVKYFKLTDKPSIVFIAGEGYNRNDNFKESIANQVSMQIEFE